MGEADELNTKDRGSSGKMMGHPGFSALEYAGKTEESEKKSRDETTEGFFKKRFGKEPLSKPPARPAVDPHDARIADTESGSQIQPANELFFDQRRAGIFFSRNPRDYERALGRRTEDTRPSNEEYELTGFDTHHGTMTTGGSGTGGVPRAQRENKRRSFSIDWLTTSSSKTPRATSSSNFAQLPEEASVARNRRFSLGGNTGRLLRSATVSSLSRASARLSVHNFVKNLKKTNTSANTGEEETEPIVTKRDPDNVTVSSTGRHPRADSREDDFALACAGEFDPYDDHLIAPRSLRSPPNPANYEDNNTRLLRAPPIPSQDVLSKIEPPDQLQHFLRNTSPPASPKKGKKGKKGKKAKNGFSFGKKDKTTATAQGDSDETSPTKNPPFRPACTEEKTTSSGARHFEIVPSHTPGFNQPLRIYKDVEITVTEERVTPPTSLFAGGAEQPLPQAQITTVITGGKAAHPRPNAEGDPRGGHVPQMARDEQTRLRKMRDLEAAKTKMKKKHAPGTTAYSGYQQTSFSPSESAAESVAAGSLAGSGAVSTVGSWRSGFTGEGLSEGVARLETLVDDLTNELAIVIGLDTEDRELDPQVVLATSRKNRRKAGRK